MAEHQTVSMEASTTGAVASFLEAESCNCLNSIKLLSFLAGALQRYEEEGVVLEPRFVLCNSIELLAASFPGGRYVIVGKGSFKPDSGKQILKQCATISGGQWAIVAERSANGSDIRFGVLSYFESPTSLDLRDMMHVLGGGNDSFYVLVEKLDTKTVLMTGSRGNSLQISFSTTKKTGSDDTSLTKFADCCTTTGCSTEFTAYLINLLRRSLAKSHGTILVCQKGGNIRYVKGMSDAVMMTPPIDLLAAFSDFQRFASADALLHVQRCEHLVVGMMQSDGIVVFDTEGKISAYRVFFKDTVRNKQKGAKQPQNEGGARRRAFEGLRSLVGVNLECALFRSQDGMMMFEGIE